VLEAVAAGVHVVADKPFAPNADPRLGGAGRRAHRLGLLRDHRAPERGEVARVGYQEQPAGRAGTAAAWGYEEEDRWGTLTTAAGAVRVPSRQGAYHACYEQSALAVAGKGELVPGSEAVHMLEVPDAARLSDAESRSVDLED
jgi:predicted dehydrogenase